MITMIFRTTTPREWASDLMALVATIITGAAVYHAATIAAALIAGGTP